jgi:hypothetical protein
MKIENTIINQNDNVELIGDLYLGTDQYGDKSRRLQYRELALRLIDKYLPEHRRVRPAQWQLMEFVIVNAIDEAFQTDKKYGRCSGVRMVLNSMAIQLDVPYIKIYNDPDLPEFMKGYQPIPGLP